MRAFLCQVAIVFGVGRWPRWPGTWGTLVTLPLVWVLTWIGPFAHMAAALLLLPLAIVAAEIHEQETGGHDAGEVVIDEVLGFLITMTWLPLTWQASLAGFVLFRALDILKPFPISILDRKVKGGLGVVIDDVAAGILANLVLQIIYTQTNWLGAQTLVVRSAFW